MGWPDSIAVLFGTLQGLGLMLWATLGAHKTGSAIDRSCVWAAAFWIVFLLLSPAAGLVKDDDRWAVLVTHLGYQGLVAAVSYFLLTSASANEPRLHAIWWLQGVLGLAAMAWFEVEGSAKAYLVWKQVNAAGATALTAVVLVRAFWGHMQKHSMVVGGGIVGLGICISDLYQAKGRALDVTLSHYFYALYLLAMWLFVTGRAGTSPALSSTQGAAQAVNDERHRIAQDLHDGVGSQLVNILSSLDAHSPQQQALALALENCLVDLKIVVDSIDNTQDSISDALARLRYRVQHSLDRLGIAMKWNVELSEGLENLRGETAGQVLRIAQEALSNVMRHSGASCVEVSCHVDHAAHTLCLEIHDNGRGGADEAAAQHGKGLQGMRRRAKLVGGRLQIESPAGGGTRIELCVPMASRPRQRSTSPLR